MLDPVREAFVQEYRKHGNASEAFRKAKPRAKNWKPEVVHNRASEMLKDGEVQVRLEELQRKSAEKHEITIERLTQMTLDAYALAMKDDVKAPSAAVKAADFLGKLHGLIVEKREHSGPGGQPIIPVLNVSVGGNQSKPSS